MRRIWNYIDHLRRCLFEELGIAALYGSRDDWQCANHRWLEVELEGEKWMLSACVRKAKTRRVNIAGETFNLCQFACKKRLNTQLREFFRQMFNKISNWKNELIDDSLSQLEARQQQRLVGIYLVSE